jgi:hypothetical protein
MAGISAIRKILQDHPVSMIEPFVYVRPWQIGRKKYLSLLL